MKQGRKPLGWALLDGFVLLVIAGALATIVLALLAGLHDCPAIPTLIPVARRA